MNYDRILLELLDRVSALEDEVKNLKANMLQNDEEDDENIPYAQSNTDSIGRDTTKYIFDGKKYGKSRLVHAIVKKYVNDNPDTTAEELMSIFDKSLQGSLGVVRKLDDVKKDYSDYERRFFISGSEIIDTPTGKCVICNQWGIANIGNMVARAKRLGMQVDTVQ